MATTTHERPVRTPTARRGVVRPVAVAGIALGIGLGGFVDGIVLHQVLQWHHMLSNHADHLPTTLENLETNVLWDGLFHVFAWLATVAGVALLWRARWTPGVALSGASTLVLLGGMAAGWGAFNLAEGVVDHHILGLHHVRDDLGGPLAWDLGFLASGVVLLALGAALISMGARRAQRDSVDG